MPSLPPVPPPSPSTPAQTSTVIRQVLSVLVVDDEPLIRTVVGQHLRGRGFDVFLAGNVPEALAALSVRQFHILITDLEMPGQNGFTLLEAAHDQYPLVRRIMLTGSTTIENALHALKLGAIGFLSKPVQLDELDVLVDVAVAELNNWMRQLSHLARAKRRSR